MLPKGSLKIPLILKEFHDSVSGGHAGFFRTHKCIFALLFWEGMKRDIHQYVIQCEVHQRNKYQTLSLARLLQPLPLPTAIWTNLTMARGVDTILVVVDRLTRYANFLAFSHPYTAKEVLEVFIKEIVKLHGFPKSIITDRDQVFMSSFWTKLFKQAATKLRYSSAYHPQYDGQLELVNRYVETYLQCFCRQ